MKRYSDLFEGFSMTIRIPQSEELCKQHKTTPEKMKKLLHSYEAWLVPCIQYYSLDRVEFNIRIENWDNGGIDTDQPLNLSWSEELHWPIGYVGLYFGYPQVHEQNSLDSYWIRDLLGHELAHVLIFCYISKFFECKPYKGKHFGYFLPESCPIPKKYIELLCDPFGLVPLPTREGKYRAGWGREEFFGKNLKWALKFILTQSKFINSQITGEYGLVSRCKSWLNILYHFLKSKKAKIWIKEFSNIS